MSRTLVGRGVFWYHPNILKVLAFEPLYAHCTDVGGVEVSIQGAMIQL
jgi:hypothetical protein